jgi:mannitol-1-phosphate/altronate dehydrogenase
MIASKNSTRLSNATVSQLDCRIRRPTYDREKLLARTVHIGVGGFHLAHQAVYLDEILGRGALSDRGECVTGVLPHDAAMHDARCTARAGLPVHRTPAQRRRAGRAHIGFGRIGNFQPEPRLPTFSRKELSR